MPTVAPLDLERPAANYEVLLCRLPGFKNERRLVEFDILIPLRPRLRIPKVLSVDLLVIKITGPRAVRTPVTKRNRMQTMQPIFQARWQRIVRVS